MSKLTSVTLTLCSIHYMKKLALIHHQDLIQVAFDFFTSKATKPEYFEEIKDFCEGRSELKRILNHDVFLKLGYLTKDSFMSYATSKKLVNGVPIAILDIIMDVFTENLILIKQEPNSMNNTHSTYLVNDGMAKFFYGNGLLFNKIFGFEFIIEKYISSVFKIENKLNGDSDIGNGFLITSYGKTFIVTNHHVVDKYDELNVYDSKNQKIEIQQMIHDEQSDLSILIPNQNIESTPFLLNLNLKILEEILTIGYPPVPTTIDSYPLCHLGEINSKVENYWKQDLFIFSAKTNPGNSGSPIIDKNGAIVGIVTQQLEEQKWYEKGKLPYYAGIPSSKIQELVLKLPTLQE